MVSNTTTMGKLPLLHLVFINIIHLGGWQPCLKVPVIFFTILKVRFQILINRYIHLCYFRWFPHWELLRDSPCEQSTSLEYGLFPIWAKHVMGAFHFMNKLSRYFIHNSFLKYLHNLKSVTNSTVTILNCKSVIATVSTILPQNQEPSVCWFFHQFHNSAGYQVNQQRSYLTV